MNPEKLPTEVDKDRLGKELSEEVKAARAAIIHDMENPDAEPAPVRSSKEETQRPNIVTEPSAEVEEVRRMVAKDIEAGIAAKGIEEEK